MQHFCLHGIELREDGIAFKFLNTPFEAQQRHDGADACDCDQYERSDDRDPEDCARVQAADSFEPPPGGESGFVAAGSLFDSAALRESVM